MNIYNSPVKNQDRMAPCPSWTLSSKYSVVGSLHHKAKTICSSPELLLQEEEKHLKQALTRCKYPAWTMNKVKMKTKATANNNSKGTMNSGNNIQKPHMVIAYYKGIRESIKKTCSEHEVQVYFKVGNTIKNLLVAQRPRYHPEEKWSHI